METKQQLQAYTVHTHITKFLSHKKNFRCTDDNDNGNHHCFEYIPFPCKVVSLFSVLLLYIAWKRGLPQKFARFVLFRLTKKRSFNLFWLKSVLLISSVFWIFFSGCWQSTLFQIFSSSLIFISLTLHRKGIYSKQWWLPLSLSSVPLKYFLVTEI